MDQKATIVESLLERAAEYGKTTYELTKLKLLEKATDLVSTVLPYFLTVGLLISFLSLLSIAVSLWLSELIGKIYVGFFIVAGFYLLIALVFHFLFAKNIKNCIFNYILKQFLKN